jgi:uncharacterized protein (TIGR02466 family)
MKLVVDNLFPTPLGIAHLDRGVTKKELEFIKKLDTHKNEGNTSSVNNYVLQLPELRRLEVFCTEAINQFFKEVYAPRDDLSLYITQSWANFTDQGQYHHRHYHTNSFLSGVFYITTHVDTDKIHFYKEFAARSGFAIPTEKYNAYNSESWWYPAEDNIVLMFPSLTMHMVEQKNTPDTRISIAFNTFFKGTLGEATALNELKLGEK